MSETQRVKRGWHFLQIPGPSNTPERIRQAISQPTLDHRGPEFANMSLHILDRLKKVFKSDGHVIIYPSSGTGAWEAALLNLFKPGDRLVAFETGHFAAKWKDLARSIGLDVLWKESDWRRGVDPEWVKTILNQDKKKRIRAVMVVHNETSTGVTSDIQSIRKSIDETGHSALLLVDVVSSLLTTDFCQEEWGVDVAICASQKGFMLPPGLSFNSINDRALKLSGKSDSLHSYWKWDTIIEMNQNGFFPYTPASSLIQGLDESLNMIFEEGMDQIFKRHEKFAKACRIAASIWGLENQAVNPVEFSNSTTALRLPDEYDADDFRGLILKKLNMSLGKGLGKLRSKVFRIGHLGDYNELMLMATLSGVEMGLKIFGIPVKQSGVEAAIDFLTSDMIKNSG